MIRIENLAKAYGSKILFNSATYHFPARERIALVGANGAGKTTLLNIICGLEDSDNGEIIKPNNMVLGYLPQMANPNPMPTIVEECIAGATKILALKAKHDWYLNKIATEYNEKNHEEYERVQNDFLNAGGDKLESKAKEILVGLNFRTSDFTRSPTELSGGWRMRLELAKVFLNNPDFLVLDEPTNHLDLPSLMWVQKYLFAFTGTVIFVSHDRELVNKMAGSVLHLSKGKLAAYKGNFDSFLEQREARAMEEDALAEKLRKRRESLESFVERFGAKATKAKQAQSKLKLISRIRDLEQEFVGDSDEALLQITLPKPPTSGKDVLTIENAAIGYTTPILQNIDLKIQRGSKVAIIGINGAGKSTLLKTIAGKLTLKGGTMAFGHNVKPSYYAQEQLEILDENSTVLANVLNSNGMLSEKQARSMLGGFLFRGDDVYKPVKVLSGGEKSRVGLARLLASEANFLILDEPTNHLDMSSVESLADAIEDYSGTMLYVSHDRSFINETCTHVFAFLPEGKTALFIGNLDDYARLSVQANLPNILDPEFNSSSVSETSGSQDNTKQLDKLANDLKKERQKLEKLLEKTEAELNSTTSKYEHIEKTMFETAATNDYKEAQKLQEEYLALKAQINDFETNWLEIGTKLDEIKAQLRAMGRA